MSTSGSPPILFLHSMFGKAVAAWISRRIASARGHPGKCVNTSIPQATRR
ncbi:hypothetical protein [Mycolicibacterium smegmatis]|uniref:Uncharacterized protein n=1 Tax=Mycolicibacterium smegmatis (strain ATCC 700084 / mc(2)155) TaxID=246196 RepID=A0QVS5_MYCS2|nr:hypothetical protein [Mycolicibacterium smegmatis]ABK69911.1 hypothetical protein MSMEG_2678 [Mycolicibacterium smegmatis MC2 155]AIU07849.1 hypothetical protein LJ00_13325 [Mycolicibacterium smegmatis MC2 155]AIU14474.1 hypothetical protein LI99_13330 [Mycolicibacterium smegmatis]AIU21097.1 hypothetical protein LI98_13335 [Mycolicibacterium smegmatis]MBE9622191.1 hypothetical protein [Mycolicibacterium smegmatis]